MTDIYLYFLCARITCGVVQQAGWAQDSIWVTATLAQDALWPPVYELNGVVDEGGGGATNREETLMTTTRKRQVRVRFQIIDDARI